MKIIHSGHKMCCGMCFHVYEVRLLGWMKVESVAIAVDFDEICHIQPVILHNGPQQDRNDHTTMTAPLPVCSAKLSIVGPG